MTRSPIKMASRLLGVLAAAALLGTAYIHADLAGNFDAIGDQVTEGALFRAQAAATAVAALWLLLRPTRLAWWLALAVSAASLVAVVGSVYVEVPAIGPFPRLYEPVWYAEKGYAAGAAGAALVLALLGLGAGRSARESGRRREWHRAQPRSS